MSSRFSGFDSEVTGFDSVTQQKRVESTISTQTDIGDSVAGTQTRLSNSCGSTADPEELNANIGLLNDITHPGLNEFLRRVVPPMLEQLDQTDLADYCSTSDSDEEESIVSKLFQDIDVKENMPGRGVGDFQPSVLGVTWSSGSNSLAVSMGHTQHENWCEHDGLLRIYTLKKAEQDKFVHILDISEKNCITVVKYHPSVAALLAYGTTSGEVVLCNLRGTVEGMQLSSPFGCHGAKRVSFLQWADPFLTNLFLTIQIGKTGKRRGASDQVLISAGCDGTVNVWQANVNLKIFECVVCFNIKSSPDITCFDFIKVCPLRPFDERCADDVFVVGTKIGQLFLCKIKECNDSSVDPVYDVLEGHSTCILEVAFSLQKPGIFTSISIDSELRIYDINKSAPLKILCLDVVGVSCLTFHPNNPCIILLGLSKPEENMIKVYNASSGRWVPVTGLGGGPASATAISVCELGSCRIAVGDSKGLVHIWDLPLRRLKLSADDLDY